MGDIWIYGIMVVLFGGYYTYLQKKKKKINEKYKKYSNSEKVVHESGVTLLPSSDRYLIFKRIVEIYKEVELCTDLTAYGPEIEYTSFKKIGISGWGYYIPVYKKILINSDKKLSRTAEDELLRHEFIHHLLHENGRKDESHNHRSEIFKCGRGVTLVNGKVVRP